MTSSADSQKTTDAYLAALRRQLRELTDEDANDIVEEIRAHILDKTSGDTPSETVKATLAALGSPEELASRYRTEELLKRAQIARSPAFILRSLFRWATLSVLGLIVFLVSVVGYCLGAGLFILGALKLISPNRTGVYGVFSTHTWALNFQSGGQNSGHDLLGWWLVPIGLLLGAVLLVLTFRFGLWSIRKFWRPRAWQEA
ncbi:MAG TPA: DUF1700 domain-containing protein [Silvibacterium sp.]|nr:DUF1700 domain-containing protein [Silvibacterium sp.]